ncbi:unnamed protein product [Schistocephalus solidus]|uniref:CASPASE_P20 domain-containing protein n=1 Tax=Schistocephalus solidus TaxID=70667 RepID=A0A183T7Z3_SCHSO|nr:unnamed protein product [Schistocephalus solidus]
MEKNVQERHLVVTFGLCCGKGVREYGIQDTVKFFDYFAFDDDEDMVNVSSPKRWPVVCKNQRLKLLDNCVSDEVREQRSHWRPSDLLVQGFLEGEVRL